MPCLFLNLGRTDSRRTKSPDGKEGPTGTPRKQGKQDCGVLEAKWGKRIRKMGLNSAKQTLWSEAETEALLFPPKFCNSWAVAHQAPLSMGFSRQEHWIGLSWPPPGDLPNPGILPHCRWIVHCWATREVHQKINSVEKEKCNPGISYSSALNNSWKVTVT